MQRDDDEDDDDDVKTLEGYCPLHFLSTTQNSSG